MKRTFQEITPGPDHPTYGQELKRRKLIDQKIGEFIVKALDVYHFRIVSEVGEIEATLSDSFFAPKFLYWLHGEDEQIAGYEGLSVNIYLSSKCLIPYVEMTWERKAAAFAKIDDVIKKLRDHYGTLYTDKNEFVQKVLIPEQNQELPGKQVDQWTDSGFVVQHLQLSLTDTTFNESNFFIQALLPFFIEAASPITPGPYWKYYLAFEQQTKKLAAIVTVFEAFLTCDKLRTKVSQVLVLPPYQRRGFASRLYRLIYDEYRADPRCFQVQIEDAADDFIRVTDTEHAKAMKAELTRLGKPMPDKITSIEQFKACQLLPAEVKQLMETLKLPVQTITRVNEILVYSRLDFEAAKRQKQDLERAFRLSCKRRYYEVLLSQKQDGFTDLKVAISTKKKPISECYVYEDSLDEDQFGRHIAMQNTNAIAASEQGEVTQFLQAIGGGAAANFSDLAKHALKHELQKLYLLLTQQYDSVKAKIALV